MKLSRKANQQGFTLIELMIGMLVGLVAVAATISAFTSIVRSNSDYLKMVRLNQELNSVMTLMTRDLKRAGYSWSATGKTADNAFMTTDPIVFSSTVTGTTTQFRKIEFSYDMDNDGSVDVDERFGYQLDTVEDAVEVKVNTWTNATDENSIRVTDLTFSNDVLYTASVAIRYIGISLTGELINDTAVSRTLTERVRVRNDLPPA